jgi:hypothetical protein
MGVIIAQRNASEAQEVNLAMRRLFAEARSAPTLVHRCMVLRNVGANLDSNLFCFFVEGRHRDPNTFIMKTMNDIQTIDEFWDVSQRMPCSGET